MEPERPAAPRLIIAGMASLMALPFAVAIAYGSLRGELFYWADSQQYLDWHPIRTAVYPLFLDAVPLPSVLWVQLSLLAGALTWLTLRVWQLTDSFILTALLTLAAIANPYLWFLQGSLMTEALTAPLLVILLGLFLAYATGGRRSDLIVASLCAGLIAATRPACLPLIIVPPTAALLVGRGDTRGSWKLALLSLALAAAPVAAERLISHVKHGDRILSLAGRHLYAKSVLLRTPAVSLENPTPLEARLLRLAEQDFEPIRQEIEAAPAGAIRDVLRFNYEVCLEYACTDRAVAGMGVSDQERGRALERVGWARIEGVLPQYLRLSWDEYRGFWFHHSDKHPTLAQRYNTYLATRGTLPFAEAMDIYAQPIPQSEQQPLYRVTRPFYILVGVLMALTTIAVAILVLRGRRHSFLIVSFLCAAGVQVLLIFTALTGVGIPRYSMSLWPLIVGALLFGLLYAGSSLAPRMPPWWRSLTGARYGERELLGIG